MDTRQVVNEELKPIELLFNRFKTINPMVVFVWGLERKMVPVIFRNPLEKDLVDRGLREIVRSLEPDYLVYMAEAWMKHLAPEELNTPVQEMPGLRNDPERIEIITVQIEFKTGEQYGCTAKILRDQKEPRLDKWDICDSSSAMGRFVGFYPPKSAN